MTHATYALSSEITTGLCFDEPGNAAWFATQAGDIQTFRVLGQRSSTLGSGWPDAVAVLPSTDGLSLRVVLRSGQVWVAARDRCQRAEASLVASIGRPTVAALRLAGDGLLLLDDEGALHRVVPADGSTAVWVAAMPGATLMAVDERNGELLLAVQAGDWELHRLRLKDGVAVAPPLMLVIDPAAMTALPNGDGVLLCDALGQVTTLRWSGAVDGHSITAPGASALCAWHSLVIVAAGAKLQLQDWGDDVALLPMLSGFDPIAVGGWVPMTVDYGAIGLTADDVDWRVREGPNAGAVAVARPTGQPADRYEHRVLAGFSAPEFQVEALDKASGQLLATRRFRTVRCWPDARIGPPMAITGVRQVFAKPGWGGGPDGPQNINRHPAPHEFRIAFAIFRTRESSSSISAESRVASLTAQVSGPGQSVKTYYEEVSYRATPASAKPQDPLGTGLTLLGNQVFGPIDIDYAWGDLYEPMNKDDPWSAWVPKGGTWDILGGEFSTFLLDRGLAASVTQQADSVVLSVLPGSDAPYMVGTENWPAQWSWAFAADAQHYWKSASTASFRRIPAVVMPAAMPADHPAPWSEREWVSTICHELGHTLGCPDLYGNPAYPAEIADRDVDAWDLMSNDAPLSHFSLAHRMRLGWVNPDWVEVCDFGKNPASRTVTLQAIETVQRSGPKAGRRAGVEVRIRDGWNYYFELRRAQPTQVGDRHLPAPNVVLGTDVCQAAADEMARPLIMLLPLDADGDGPLLRRTGNDYIESDVTNPERMNDFRIRRLTPLVAGPGLPSDPDSVRVEIQYVGAHRPELQITPAPGRDNFKSPDIDIDGPAGPNVVVKGRLNTLTIRVHNKGSKAADAVRIHVRWLPFTTAPGSWNELATPAMQAIPAHASRSFSVPWQTPASLILNDEEVEHFCIRVDIERYVDPTDPAGNEVVVHNNWAQSNFSTAAVGHSSPSERQTTLLRTSNRLKVGALHHTLVEQSSEHFRAYVNPAWQWLAAGETRHSTLSYESLAGDPQHDQPFQRVFREGGGERVANDLRARCFIQPDRERDGAVERWGVQLHVRAGLRSHIDRLQAHGERVDGRVLAGDGSSSTPVDGGTVRLIAWPLARPALQTAIDCAVAADGSFRLAIPGELLRLVGRERVLVEAYFLGTPRYAPCRSKALTLRAG